MKWRLQHMVIALGILLVCTATGWGQFRRHDPNRCPRWNGYFPHIDHCSEIPAGAVPVPNGSYVAAHRAAHAMEADHDDFVIYRYEWFDDSESLGPFGSRHMERLARVLRHGSRHPVVVEPVGEDAGLTHARRAKIIEILANHGIHNPEKRVLVGYSAAEGLYGPEAEFIYPRMIQPQNRGFGRGGFGGIGGFGRFGGFGGFGGGGFGGGGLFSGGFFR